MKPNECPKFERCPKLLDIMDKDILEAQLIEAIREVCQKCEKPS